MERLTIPDKHIDGKIRMAVVDTREVKKHAMTLYWQLKKYEDTGITPEQLKVIDEEYSRMSHELAMLRQQNRWIPVSEELPKNPDELVLVMVSGKPARNITLEKAHEIASYNADDGWILEMYPEWEDAQPIAWMPLPEPYI